MSTPDERDERANRAQYFTRGTAYNMSRAVVLPHVFAAEREHAFDPRSGTGLVSLDLSPALELDFPATTPLMLARYVRVREGESLETGFVAGGQLYYVIRGRGTTTIGSETIRWSAGDVFCLPANAPTRHAADADAVLWCATDEPVFSFLGAAPAPGPRVVPAVHYPRDVIGRELDTLLPGPIDWPGKAVTFGHTGLAKERTMLPTLTLHMNSMWPGESQRSHVHNAAAITLVIEAQGCHSLVGEAASRVEWTDGAVMVTPPGEPHSHHNDGMARARFLVVQDGGLHYHMRTNRFRYT